MERVIIDTEKTPKPIGPYSKAVKIINPKSLIFVSGHGAPPRGGCCGKGHKNSNQTNL